VRKGRRRVDGGGGENDDLPASERALDKVTSASCRASPKSLNRLEASGGGGGAEERERGRRGDMPMPVPGLLLGARAALDVRGREAGEEVDRREEAWTCGVFVGDGVEASCET
jgi:hypothetical protein